MGGHGCSELTSLRRLVDVLRTQQEAVAEVLEGAGPGRARVMVRLRAPLVTAPEGGSEVLAERTSLKGAKGKDVPLGSWEEERSAAGRGRREITFL